MPIYDYQCGGASGCGHIERDLKKHPDETYVQCPKCAKYMKRMLNSRFSINMGAAGAHGYFDENLGKYINTNYERREEMLKQGVTEKGATPKNGVTWV